LAVGAGGEFRSPMAIAVIGGLIVSTLLSLLFVPAFFTLMDDLGRLSWRAFGRFVGGPEADPGHAAAHAEGKASAARSHEKSTPADVRDSEIVPLKLNVC